MQRRFTVDDVERHKRQDPDLILKSIGLKAGDTLIDLGSGEGYFAVPAARIVGPQGKIYALDRNNGSIEILAETARREKLENMALQAGRAEDNILCDRCADFVFLGTVLHDLADPVKVLRNAAAMLKPTGKLIVLDWQKRLTPIGPPVWKRLDEAREKEIIQATGFVVDSLVPCGPYHYLITASLTSENK